MSIDELAALIRAGLDADHKAASDLLHAARIPDKQPNFFAAGGPAAQALWRRYSEHRVLAEVRAKRALLDELLAEEHTVVGPVYYLEDPCPAEEGTGPCECGRDARIQAYLTLLAQPYQETT